MAPEALFLGLAAALLLCLVLALVSGSVHLTVARLWEALALGPAGPGAQGAAGPAAGPGTLRSDWAIVWQLRLPRTLLAALVGLALGASGALLQGLFRNPMADPYVTGVSSGGALGATLVLALGWFGRAGGAGAAAAGGGAAGAFA
ncbi:MAG: iron chelate uptake ABC transporter family permease subunit, partial [Clostridia bacterium]|nr:iron chelate uptake ABC transporter family permease subunit [Clostridia bacterium]